MINNDKIQRLLQRGEHERVAFHTGASEAELREVVATVAAMANGTGGTIFFGVDSSGHPTGLLENHDMAEEIMAKISAWTTPALSPTADYLHTPAGRILAIHVLPAANPPVMTGGIAYRRNGSSNAEMTRTDLDRTLRSIPQSFDRRPMPGTTLNDLDEERLRRYIRQRQEAYPQSSPLIGTTEELWEEVKAVVMTEEGAVPTVAGILFFSRDPSFWISHARVKLARFPGTAPVAFVDRQEPTGTLPELLDLAEAFIKRNTRMASQIIGFESVVVTEYPYPALREALVNAFAHRDWETRHEAVQINIFSDRIEVHSPGEPLLPLDQLEGAHASRNDNLCYLFKDIGAMEQYGTGVARMRALMEEHGLLPPRFEKQGPIFKVTFPGPGDRILNLMADPTARVDLRTLGLNDRQIDAMRLLRNEGKAISNAEYRIHFGVSDRTALRDLSSLVELGLIRRIGNGPQSFYVASEGDNHDG
ncbi:MAG: putative DNA binding domain-containing protein [Ardenticatenales bacterium]|nr:putative DNA binding domain-containing protein [Ardenticatenales bacterium]